MASIKGMTCVGVSPDDRRPLPAIIQACPSAFFHQLQALVQLKQAQNRIESLEKELKDALAEHQQSLDQYRKSAQQRYESELDALKNQLNTLIKLESSLKDQLNVISHERDDLMQERASAKEKSSERRREIEEVRCCGNLELMRSCKFIRISEIEELTVRKCEIDQVQ